MYEGGTYLKVWVNRRWLGLGFMHGLEKGVTWFGDFVICSALKFGWAGVVGALGFLNDIELVWYIRQGRICCTENILVLNEL